MTIKNPEIVDDFYDNKYSEKQIRNFMKKYPKKINKVFWWIISQHQILSESFLIEFKDSIDWWDISEHQILSEDFIREFKDKVYWWGISMYQTLSEPFMLEFIKDIEIGDRYAYGLKDNEKIPEDVKKRIIDLKKVINQ